MGNCVPPTHEACNGDTDLYGGDQPASSACSGNPQQGVHIQFELFPRVKTCQNACGWPLSSLVAKGRLSRDATCNEGDKRFADGYSWRGLAEGTLRRGQWSRDGSSSRPDCAWSRSLQGLWRTATGRRALEPTAEASTPRSSARLRRGINSRCRNGHSMCVGTSPTPCSPVSEPPTNRAGHQRGPSTPHPEVHRFLD